MTARELALRVLAGDRPGAAFAGDRLDDALRTAGLTPPDRRLATELVYGVLRRRGTLDVLLTPMLRHEPPREVLEALRLGAYQLLFLDHVPPHAAIHESVELAANFYPHLRGLVNAVLRNLQRRLTDRETDTPAANALPLTDGRYRVLAMPVLPEPAKEPSTYLSAAFALPAWMAERWIPRHEFNECLRRAFWFLSVPPLWLRVNGLQSSREQLVQALAEHRIEVEPGESADSLKLLTPTAIRDLPGYDAGWFTVQDESATHVAAALAPKPGWAVLDRCAAPGGKSTHLAELMGDVGRVVACDVDERKLETVRTLASRLKLKSVETVLLARDEPPPAGPFDAALVDAPCSNTGVLGRRPEVRWRVTPDDLAELVPLQRRLLGESLDRVRPGGAAVYATCSIEPEENGGVVRAVLAERPDWRIDFERDAVPGRPADGGYLARLVRSGD